MVSPSQRRAVLAWAQQAYQVSERRACRGLVIHRAMIRIFNGSILGEMLDGLAK